jgi:hypothetical protein
MKMKKGAEEMLKRRRRDSCSVTNLAGCKAFFQHGEMDVVQEMVGVREQESLVPGDEELKRNLKSGSFKA